MMRLWLRQHNDSPCVRRRGAIALIGSAAALTFALAATLTFVMAAPTATAAPAAPSTSADADDAGGALSEQQRNQFFTQRVLPILNANCFKCHGGGPRIKSGLRLTSRAGVLKGGAHGAAVSLDKPDASVLLKAISYDDADLKMPPPGKLKPQQIDTLRRWVALGLPWDPAAPLPKVAAAPEAARSGPPRVTAEAMKFWSFQPVHRPDVPAVKNAAWVRNPIDAFVLHRLEQAGLAPAPPADKVALMRRAFYDLTGLPPTPAEAQAFIADDAPDAYEKMIERLLASPHYGEKWARHWLDLVRFAETNSYERDSVKPNAWRYRDYVIRAINDDKPYDQFVREQLAGDEMPDASADAWIATGYFRLGIWDDEPSDPPQAFYDGLDDIVKTTGQVFLGLTLDCARCHDHKIDPIPQADYYRMLAFFHNLTPMTKNGPTIQRAISVGNEKDKALVVTEKGRNAPPTYILIRGSAHAQGDKVEPGFPQVLGYPDPVIPDAPPDAHTTGRRTVLANWIASKDNKLTARVMINRIWQHHFGRGIVRSPSNFGYQGDRPTHPLLLDWLADQFMAHGWSIKAMHRLIMTSNAYRMSSAAYPAALAKDPSNDLLWRFDMRRLNGEEIRDSILAINGTLNSQMFGPGVYTAIPQEVLAGQSRPGDGWGNSPPDQRARRSIYIHVKRSLLTPILESFDMPETDLTCPVRFATTQPTQALGLLNGQFIHEQAALFAQRVKKEAANTPTAQVARALTLVTQRTPTKTDIARGVQLIRSLQNEDGASPDDALRYYCLVALNLNEFIYLD